MDYTSTSHPCPGREAEYEKQHGISGTGLFFAIVVPIALAAGAGYWVWRNWEGRMFGSIRLGEGGSSLGGGPSFDTESAWVRWPVMALSAVVAVIAATPMVVGGVWRAVSGRFGRVGGGGGGGGRFGGGGGGAEYGRPYTSRSSFARGRGDYAIVDPDEGELLGEESDEEVV